MTRSRRGPIRLLLDGVAEGARNMALDRAIQLECAAGRSPATVRLYGWARPTVSLGRFQDLGSVDVDACRAEGVDVVRRFTGGRGVLHDNEVTYAVVAGLQHGVPKGTAASYRFVCAALVDAYSLLGVQADLTQRPRGARSSGACYLHASQADVSYGMKKLSGSAQIWHHNVVLQHGSLVMTRDVERESRIFRLTAEESHSLATRTVTMAGLLSEPPDRTDVIDALTRAFGRLFGVSVQPGRITAVEKSEALKLLPYVDIASSPRTSSLASP